MKTSSHKPPINDFILINYADDIVVTEWKICDSYPYIKADTEFSWLISRTQMLKLYTSGKYIYGLDYFNAAISISDPNCKPYHTDIPHSCTLCDCYEQENSYKWGDSVGHHLCAECDSFVKSIKVYVMSNIIVCTKLDKMLIKRADGSMNKLDKRLIKFSVPFDYPQLARQITHRDNYCVICGEYYPSAQTHTCGCCLDAVRNLFIDDNLSKYLYIREFLNSIELSDVVITVINAMCNTW